MSAEVIRRNAFQETMLGLEYSAESSADIFSRACVESFSVWSTAQFSHLSTQVFEPGVLREVAYLAELPFDSVDDLRHRPTSSMRKIGELVDRAAELTVVESVNLVSLLINISRFTVAARLLADLRRRVLTSRESFEVGWLQFLISNRCDDGADSPAAFARMRQAIADGGVPRGRILDACTQAVVWYIKRREVPEDVFQWSVRCGSALARESHTLDASTVSSWYRGIAMLPAANRDRARTHSYMELAREAAERSVRRRRGAVELNFLKTYFESSLKEHMYVTRDQAAAEEAGRALIDLDPSWSVSYGELAEARRYFGDLRGAAELYERAVGAGPPYVAHHLLHAARSRVASGDHETALRHFDALAELAPATESLLVEGLTVARRVRPAAGVRFIRALRRLDAATPTAASAAPTAVSAPAPTAASGRTGRGAR